MDQRSEQLGKAFNLILQKSKYKMNRRKFVQTAFSVALGICAVNRAIAAYNFVAPDNPTAVALKYVEDADQANRAEKMGVAGDKQICANCRFYASPEADAAGCSLLGNKAVPAKAWCAAWVPAA